MDTVRKAAVLDSIAADIRVCPICRLDTSGMPVPGEGNPDAGIVFVGEAPGRKESETGRPFIGPSGTLLNHELERIGIRRVDVFITSVGKYYPGKRAPTDREIAHGKTHLDAQISVIDPETTVLLGRTAVLAVLDSHEVMIRLHGKPVRCNDHTYFVMYHPAAALRSVKTKEAFSRDFDALRKYLDR